MIEIHVNLKRFDVPKSKGGICPSEDPVEWMDSAMTAVVDEMSALGDKVNVVIYPPESLLGTAVKAVAKKGRYENISVGSQGVFVSDVVPGGNFGAFTTSLPASAAVTYGCRYALIGHSEERAKRLGFLQKYDSAIDENPDVRLKATKTVNDSIVDSAKQALAAGLKVTLCVGETAEEKGDGDVDFDAIGKILKAQIEGLAGEVDPKDLIIAYEPRWAIGPGKTPPGTDYIGEISKRIKTISKELFGAEVPVLYGGGLKLENAEGIGGVPTTDGGLIALTKFTDPIGFDAVEMSRITEKFLAGTGA